MKAHSAGFLLYRYVDTECQVLLAHPGGPFWSKKDVGAWSIPKGELEEGESALKAAAREFQEEMGMLLPAGRPIFLGTFTQSSAKDVTVWALEADVDLTQFKSDTATIEWPPKSGNHIEIPENDKAAWWRLPEAQLKLFSYQVPMLDALCSYLGITADAPRYVPLETIAQAQPPNIPDTAASAESITTAQARTEPQLLSRSDDDAIQTSLF